MTPLIYLRPRHSEDWWPDAIRILAVFAIVAALWLMFQGLTGCDAKPKLQWQSHESAKRGGGDFTGPKLSMSTETYIFPMVLGKEGQVIMFAPGGIGFWYCLDQYDSVRWKKHNPPQFKPKYTFPSLSDPAWIYSNGTWTTTFDDFSQITI
jgi:hypothetical protein